MNYLELVQETIRESGAHLNVPDSFTGLDGLQLRFKNWVRDAWKEMQIERSDWSFRQEELYVDLDPVTLTNEVIVAPSALTSDIEQNWKLLHMRDVYIHDTANIEEPPSKLFYVSWSRWPEIFGRTDSRQEYNINEVSNERKPIWYTVSPSGDLHVYPRPDKEYQIQFFAPKAVQELLVDTDEPYLDEPYRPAIMYRALMEFGLFHDDRGVFERARNKYRAYKKGIEHRYMPDVNLRTDSLYNEC